MKFLHALKTDEVYLAHTPTGTGVPSKHFNREHYKFGLKFSVSASITSGLVGVSSQSFFPYDVPRARVYKVGTIFGRPAP